MPNTYFLMRIRRNRLTLRTHHVFSLYAHGRELMTGAVRVLDGAPLGDDVHGTQWITTPVFDWLERWYALAPKSEDPQSLRYSSQAGCLLPQG